jgi:hypothetical protein
MIPLKGVWINSIKEEAQPRLGFSLLGLILIFCQSERRFLVDFKAFCGTIPVDLFGSSLFRLIDFYCVKDGDKGDF